MPSASTSGSDAKSGSAHQRAGATPQAGNQQRSWTPEQKAAVLRVKNCQPTDYYAILDLTALKPPATCSSSDVKKAYRKLSLLTHPDKNGHEHAHVAFQMVSKAYLVLSDEGKKEIYDRSGRDPDSRFGGSSDRSGGAPSNGFRNHRAGGGRAGGWEEEISPEEMFRQFFGGGGGGGGGGFGPFGGGLFDGGGASPFVFQMGGGPGIRVHQFGGARPQRRARADNAGPETAAGLKQMILNILPLLLIVLFPLLTSLLSGSASAGADKPSIYFPPLPHTRAHDLTPQSPIGAFRHGAPPHTLGRVTRNWHVEYYVNPAEVADYSKRNFMDLDRKAELRYMQLLRLECQARREERQRLVDRAQGIFGLWVDTDKMNEARNVDLSACVKLHSLGG